MKQSRPPTLRRAAALTTAMAVGAGLVLTGAVSPAAAATPAPDLHYAMDGVTGTTVPDSSGNGYAGTISGSTAVVPAETGSALDLTGGHVVIPRGILADATDLTVSTRVRWDGGGAWQWLFGLGSSTSQYLFLTPSNGDGNLRTAVTRNGAGAEATVTGAGPIPKGAWVDLTVTLDTTADRLTTYLDGAAVSSAATDVTASQLLSASATNAGYLGRSFYPDPAFDGAVDDFQVFRSALTATQVAELAGPGVPTLQSVSTTTVELRTPVGTAPTLPATVRGAFSDGYARDVPVAWAAVDPQQYAASGVFTVTGDAGGFPVTARVTVHRGEVRVDLAQNTGDFDGGASGALYGLYGDDMPTSNLVEGMKLRSVATKAQDGAQQPGSDALEVLPTMAAADGDVLLRVTDWYRGFPYQWPGDTPAEKLADYRKQLDHQLDLIASVPADQREHLVIEPFNEPEGNMFGTGQWSLNGTSWLDDPDDYFAAWDAAYTRIKQVYPDMRVAGPGLSVLFPQMQGFLQHAVQAGTVPDLITWHELSDPATIRTSVDRFRGYEAAAFAGTEYVGQVTPININEYAFNYHTSVPGQMIQWIAALEDKKVDGMIAYWNINGNLDDSAVQQNRANGQWWLYNAYGQMSGHTVALTPPSPGQSYTLQGVSALDEQRHISRTLIGGGKGSAPIDFVNVPADVFGSTVRVQVREIPWTGQIGDSPQPTVISDRIAAVSNGALTLGFGSGDLPPLTESSAYEIVLTPGNGAEATSAAPAWHASYEAEDAAFTGTGYSRNGPEGTPQNVSNYFTSGNYDVGGLRAGAKAKLSFTVDVPEAGPYDLQVFANTLNTYPAVVENGPTNVFMTVDGAAEQQMLLPLAYKFVVWDHSDTTVELSAGRHVIALATDSITGVGTTKGDAIVDRIRLERAAAPDAVTDYEAELSDIEPTNGGGSSASDPDLVSLTDDQSATFWVYGQKDAEATLEVLGSGSGTVELNGVDVLDLGDSDRVAVSLQGGVNRVVVHGAAVIDKIRVSASENVLPEAVYQAEDAALAGSATKATLSNAEGGIAVDAIGGAPGNENTLTFAVDAASAGPHAVVVRFSNPEQTPATHYNPNPMARRADVSVNGGADRSVLFVPTFHRNNFWERTIVLDLKQGANTIRFSSEEQKNWDGVTYFQDNFPNLPLRANVAPIIDRISVSPVAAAILAPVVVTPTVNSASGANAAGWHRSTVTVALASSDPDAEVQYRIGGTGDWSTVTGPVTVDTDGVTVVEYRALNAGVTAPGSEGSVEVALDRSTPVTSAVVDPAGGTVDAGGTVTARFSATDATSGVAGTEYSVDGGATWVPATEAGVSFTAVGSHVVQYRSIDVAGNLEQAKQVTLTVAEPADVAKVTITSADPANAVGWFRQAVLVKLQAPVLGSKVQYRVNGGAWRTYASSITVNQNGITTIEHRLLRSNVVVVGSAAQTQVKVDRTAPKSTAERTPERGTGSPRNPISVELAGSDTVSGLDRLEYRVNSGAWQTAPAEAIVFGEVGDYVVGYRAVDVAGNASAARSLTVSIQADVATTVKASAKTVRAGATITLSLSGFARWDDVALSIGGVSVGQVLTDQNGAARITVRVPAALTPGATAVVATGTDAGVTATTTVTVR